MIRVGRLRRWIAAGVVLTVAALGGLIYLRVTVTRLFDGPIWTHPSRIYSDVLKLAPGDSMPPGLLIKRLDRSGYAHSVTRPAHPGEYRWSGGTLSIHGRSFPSETGTVARRFDLEFRGDRIRRVRDADGREIGAAVIEPELLATLYGPVQEERRPIAVNRLPTHLLAAALAAEDARFLSHHGIDPRGVLRAAWTNARNRRVVQGGSTITQQTVKNLYLGQERTWWRKLREATMALVLDASYSKQRILETYLNEVYLGQRGAVAICGVQAAARFYFGRNAADLTLAESALVAGMIRSPGRYNPFAYPRRAEARQNQVLAAMVRLGMIDEAAARAARREALHLASGQGGFQNAPWVVDHVRSQLEEIWSSAILIEDGLSIYTTLDTRWQTAAEESVRRGLERLETEETLLAARSDRKRLEAVSLVLDPRDGAILALVGGRDYGSSQFNRAVQARRQPGSCFKPFVFTAGFERAVRGESGGLTPATILDDSPLERVSGGRAWNPANYDRTHRGPVTVRTTLEDSLNVPTVRAAERIGLEHVIDGALRCGVHSPLKPVPSLALGSAEMTPLELATAYGTLAARGMQNESWLIREVRDRQERVLVRHTPSPTRAVSPETAWLVTDILRGVVVRGTARTAADLGYHGVAAGKTGTTDDTRDAWFVGYTPEVVALVWVGYDDNTRTGLTGATGALPIWAELMSRGPRGAPGLEFAPPPGVFRREVCAESGEGLSKGCPRPIEEWFARGAEPTGKCSVHGRRLRRWLQRVLGERKEKG